MNEFKKKMISVLLIVMMVMSMCITVSADEETSLTAYSGQLEDGNYSISTPAQLTALAAAVNTGHDYSESTFTLLNNITLSGTWTPIGGMWSNNTATPSGNAFAGVFNGNNKTIDGLNVSMQKSGIGLFGYVNGGVIGNLTVTGSVSNTGAYAAIGGIVGYTNGSLVKCVSNVTVNASSTSSSNVGGLAGVVENTVSTAVEYEPESSTYEKVDTQTVVIDHCKSTKDVTAGKRVGGLIGGAYASVTGRVLVDGCSVTDGDNLTTDYDIKGLNSAYKSFFGGLIGYCEASVSNCVVGENVKVYADSGNDGHRMGGIAGILSGYNSAKGRLSECIFLGAIENANSSNSYDGAICIPENGTSMTNCFYSEELGVTQNTSHTHSNVLALTERKLKGQDPVSGTAYINTYLDVAPSWNSGFINEWTCGTTTSGAYPYVNAIDAKTTAELNAYGRGTSYTGSDSAYASSVIYYDGTATASGDGTEASPYNNFATAVSNIDEERYLCTKSAIPVTEYTASIASDLEGKTIARSYTYDGPIFTVGSNETLSLSSITIDGNSTTRGNDSLILVNGGTFTLGASAKLMNNSTIHRSSAVRVESGSTFTMSGGSITGNTSALGGVIYVANGATFSLGSANGIASGQMVYLANTNGNSDAYISLTSALTANITVKMAHPASGRIVAKASTSAIQLSSYSHVVYAASEYTVISGGESSEDIKLS